MHSVHPTPKFSIITVTYNAEKVLEDTIQSVISQTYHHIEYIIVDGASKDGTLSIINRYRSRIHTVVSEPDKGLYDAMNKGIALASGDYLCFLNAGDCFMRMIRCNKWCTPSTAMNCPIYFTEKPLS